MRWNPLHLAFGALYVTALILIGIFSGSRKESSNRFLNATGSLPLWVCCIACIAANCGSLDVMAMMALGSEYGILAAHFYWIGSIPALLAVAFWFLPAYSRRRYTSVLDLLEQHYGAATRTLVALCMAVMMLLLCGVCLCAVAEIFVSFLGGTFTEGIVVTAPVVLFYTWRGGVRAAIYSELVHFAVVLLAIVPLSFLVVSSFGGLRRLHGAIPLARLHAWQGLPWFAPHAPMDRLGLIFGLGLILSFGYWSTDFVQMQRMLAVREQRQVSAVPLALGGAKLLFAFLILLPGIAAPLVLTPEVEPNATLPAMLLRFYNSSWVIIGILGIVATLVSTFANNISGFTSAWINGIYRPAFYPTGSEEHYVGMSRMSSAVAVLVSIGGAYAALEYRSLMDYMQMLFSIFNAPLFALVACAAILPRATANSGVAGFSTGLVCSIFHQVLVRTGVLHYGSQMNANFYGAILGFAVTVTAMALIRSHHSPSSAVTLEVSPPGALFVMPSISLIAMAAGLALLCIGLNLLFW